MDGQVRLTNIVSSVNQQRVSVRHALSVFRMKGRRCWNPTQIDTRRTRPLLGNASPERAFCHRHSCHVVGGF